MANATANAQGNIEAKIQDTSLTIVRRFKAPIEAVYQAWTDAEELKRWMAPGPTMVVALAQSDPKVGGRYRIVMQAHSGEEHRVGGVYREIAANRKLVFTWAWESTPERESLVTVELKAMGKETELTLTHERFADAQARDKHNQGWNGCLENLAKRFQGTSGASAVGRVSFSASTGRKT